MADEDKVWVQLYIIGETDAGRSFKVVAKGDIYDLQEAVKEKRPNRLSHVDAADLKVYEPGIDFPAEGEEQLDADKPVSNYTTEFQNPLRVVAPENVNQQQNKQQGKNFMMLSFRLGMGRSAVAISENAHLPFPPS